MTITELVIIAVLVLCVLGLGLLGGFLVNLAMPKAFLQKGDKVDIFLDGVYNRTATISGVTGDRLFIYDTLPLPLDYRGKFYAKGTDMDGVEFWYLKNRKHYYLVPFADKVADVYHTLSNPENLCPITTEEDLITAAQRQMADAEKLKEEKDETEEAER